ncbi:MAG: ATP-binding protein [Mycobacterium sp.]|nr:ATP-binding protein [Mycobacterium sp.]
MSSKSSAESSAQSTPLVPRQALERLVEILDTDPPGGVALLGSEGVGKTTLAGQAAERLGRGDPVWVLGTAALSMVPFGAFGSLIEIHDVGKPAALIQSAAESLLVRANSAPIIVDNARLLDPLSATLVYQLALEASRAPASPLIVNVRSVLRAPQVVSALWEDGLLQRFDVPPLDAAETAAIVAAAPGRRGADAATMYRHSAGNALHLQLLLATGGTEETLAGAIDRYLSQLPQPVRDVLAYLCIFEPLNRDHLVALTDEETVAKSLETGAIQSRDTGVYAGHPLFLERLATSLDKALVQRLRTAVAGRLATEPSQTPADRLSRTLLALQCDAPVDGDSVVAATQEALRLGDLGLAERLARGALDRGEQFSRQFEARLALSSTLAWQGRGREADAVLAAVDTTGLSDQQVMDWAVPRAANQFWMLSEPERATAFLNNVRRRVITPSARITLDALSATFAMNAGNVHHAVAVAEQVLAHPDAPDMAVAWAASAAALSSARMGHFAAVAPLVDRALSSEYPGLLRFTVGLAETTTLLMAGQIQTAYETAQLFTDFAELAQPGRAIGEVLLAQVLLARGEAAAAEELLRPASATLERTGYSWGPLALTLLATALGYQGNVPESAKALARAQARHGTKSAMFAPELGVARAWRLATIDDRPGAITAARDAARMAQRSGQNAIAVRAWHEAARLGDRRAAAGLAQIIDAVDCAYTRMAMEHASALAAGDAAGLAAAAEQLAAAGFNGAAEDARTQAEMVG